MARPIGSRGNARRYVGAAAACLRGAIALGLIWW